MPVPSQLSGGDVKILISIMDFLAERGNYSYLEIGSYLGASLQWHLKNNKCTKIVSVDKRSRDQIKDERHLNYAYSVSTKDMIDTLIANDLPIDRLVTIDGTVDDLFPVSEKFDLVFIDAEHTNHAAAYDSEKCLHTIKDDAVIMFHDDWIVYQGIEQFEKLLIERQQRYLKMKISGSVVTVFVFGNLIENFDQKFSIGSVPWAQFTNSAEQQLKRVRMSHQGNQP